MDLKKEETRSLKKAFKQLVKYFEGDYDKVFSWLMAKNPGLGNVAPLMMIAVGRKDKLCLFIDNAIKGVSP